MPHATINGIDINYRLDGHSTSGPVVMFSNSLASNLTMWDLQVEPLEMEGFRVLRYDSRGHGQSSAPEGPYTIDLLADDAAALIDHLGVGPVHFCGLSKGGMVAMNMGVRHPEKVRTLTIADSAAHMAPKDTWDDRVRMVTAGGMASVVDGTIDRWITTHGQQRMEDQVEKVRNMILNTPVTGFVACCRAIQAMDQRETIKAIDKPTLVVVGDKDPSTTPAHAKEIADAVPGAELEIIADAAHLANIEQPVAFTDALLKFLLANK
jgi:3-oxoadipate enol-lactonase